MTTEFQNKITNILFWAFAFVAALNVLVDVLVDTPNLLSGFVYPVVLVKYLAFIVAYAMLFFGIYSYVYQRQTGCKFKLPLLLIIFGLAFSLLHTVPAVVGLNTFSRGDSSSFTLQIFTFKVYLRNISLIFVVYLMMFLFYLKRLLSAPKVGTT